MKSSQRTLVPSAIDYFKCLLALLFLPVVGPLWAFIKGLLRLTGKKIRYAHYSSVPIYKSDKRYKYGVRTEGYKKKRVFEDLPIADCDASDVKKFKVNAAVYTFLGATALICQILMICNK